MNIKEQDFSSDFLKKYKEDELKILLDFCNTFYTKYRESLSRETIIDRMSTLDGFEHVYEEDKEHIAFHRVVPSEDNTKFVKRTLGINHAKFDEYNNNEKKAYIYHELIHHMSSFERPGKTIQLGLKVKDIDKVSVMDEIFTEYYAIQLLKEERY